MKTVLSLVVAMALGWALRPSPVPAQDPIAVTGEILDMSCYLSHELKGRSHRTCAQQCAKRGLPIGVLSENGDIYLLLEDHNNAEPYDQAKGLAGEKAEVKGKKFSRGGVNSILVAEVKAQ